MATVALNSTSTFAVRLFSLYVYEGISISKNATKIQIYENYQHIKLHWRFPADYDFWLRLYAVHAH